MQFTIDASEAYAAFENIKPTQLLMRDIAAYACNPVVQYQRDHCPVDTQRTKNSVRYDIIELSEGKVTATVGPTTPYAVYIEYGTGIYAENGQGRTTPWSYVNRLGRWVTTEGNPAQPFIRPSATDPRVKDAMDALVNTKLNQFLHENWHK